MNAPAGFGREETAGRWGCLKRGGYRTAGISRTPGARPQAGSLTFFSHPVPSLPAGAGLALLSLSFPSPAQLRLTTRVPESLDEEARLLLDAFLDAALAHAKVPQRGDGKAPELFGALSVAERNTCGGECMERELSERRAGGRHGPPQRTPGKV